ncbi:2-amino-4-hydroxy-6-hydroxymethyldihydropteridine diphosphokinase [Peptostreptococcus faecalis]|uniref:2-amino-4-hydroxy-6- hydroxymethyldihydropteridine diphosphokinase n=1 Tax=Peptostreptococcus faecalis TaxID=2045015 RepID=UPI000C7BCC25|nr:2-amino-4-hydroxy-6-hydroxymethyldihydropteridine diphosphokinase [Peptostreptococcus faecalis]
MDTINIKGIEFYGYHGVLDSEKKLGQMFSIDCVIGLDTSISGDDINNTVNYGDVSLKIVEFCKNNAFDLLEALVNNLSKYLLKTYPLIEELTVTVHKPHAPIATKFDDVSLTVTRKWITCYLAIGSNLGDKTENLDLVSKEINADEYISEISKSSYIETAPYGVEDQPNFLNGAIKVRTLYTPYELLRFCKSIEKKAKREKTRHWGERTLDVDILMHGNEIIFEDDLKIPHPEMHLRDFVLEPLYEIEPYLIHPIKKESVSELLKKIK